MRRKSSLIERDEVAEHLVRLLLVRHERVDLGDRAQADALLEVVHLEEVLHPARVDDAQHDLPLEFAQVVRADLVLLGLVPRERRVRQLVGELVAGSPRRVRGPLTPRSSPVSSCSALPSPSQSHSSGKTFSGQNSSTTAGDRLLDHLLARARGCPCRRGSRLRSA